MTCRTEAPKMCIRDSHGDAALALQAQLCHRPRAEEGAQRPLRPGCVHIGQTGKGAVLRLPGGVGEGAVVQKRRVGDRRVGERIEALLARFAHVSGEDVLAGLVARKQLPEARGELARALGELSLIHI